jgi:hypothetical protein
MVAAMQEIVARSLVLALLGTWLAAGCGGDESPYEQVDDWQCFEQKLPSAGGAGGASATGAAGASAMGAAGASGGLATGGAEAVAASCDCFGVRAGVTIDDPRPMVSSCSGWRCCFAWPTSDGAYDCRCEDEPPGVQLAGFCANAAAERGGEVVDNCPPTPRDNAAYCAFQGESCAPEYLEEQSLNGCCQDLVCTADAYGNAVCR